MPQYGAHDVHLRVARCGIAAGLVDLLQHRRRGRDAEARAAILLGDQDRQPTRLGQCLDEFRRIAALAVESAPVGAVELEAQRAHRVADLRMGRRVGVFAGGGFHGRGSSPPPGPKQCAAARR